MVFWIVTAVITAAAAIALIAPLFGNRQAVGERESEIAIYRDQLAEIERDVDRGVLPASEAESARTEIARRLLRAGEGKDVTADGQSGRRRAAMWIAILIVPVVALGGYLALGEPGAEDQPIAERRADPAPDDLFAQFDALGSDPTLEEIAALGESVDAALALDPENPAILEMATITRFQTGRLDDATDAYLRLLDLVDDPASVDPGGDFGTTLGVIHLAQEEITDQAATLVRRVAAEFPFNGFAMVNLGRLMIFEGNEEGGVAVLQELIDTEPPGGEPWSDIVRQILAGFGVETPPIVEATPSNAAPILDMSPEEQMAFIEQMVGQLAARLEAEPNDPQGWAQLITSYIVLERREDAEAALARAREVFIGNTEALQSIEEAAAPLMEQP